ncbi:PilZ domain-containing protein [candidate division KSB1 bacterium]|nr:PilZ domain-containing protein [candidate division KSB1 bacterium]
MEERRQFVRHPIEIPLTYKVLKNERRNISQTTNLSDFGISFLSDEPIPEGQILEIHIYSPRQHLYAKSIVKWKHYLKNEGKFQVGVMFISKQAAFRARMLEQAFRIDLYRQRKMAEEAREIPYSEAALEWIDLHAKEFAEGLA